MRPMRATSALNQRHMAICAGRRPVARHRMLGDRALHGERNIAPGSVVEIELVTPGAGPRRSKRGPPQDRMRSETRRVSAGGCEHESVRLMAGDAAHAERGHFRIISGKGRLRRVAAATERERFDREGLLEHRVGKSGPVLGRTPLARDLLMTALAASVIPLHTPPGSRPREPLRSLPPPGPPDEPCGAR